MRALFGGLERQRQAAPQPAIGRRLVVERADGALAARTDQQRTTKTMERGQPVHQLEVMRDTLAEADARIDDNLRAVDSGVDRGLDPVFEPEIDFDQGTARVVGRLLHRFGLALVMHQDDRHACFRHHPRRPFVPGQSGDVVDQRRAGAERGFHHACLAGVDRHRGAARAERGDQRQHPLDLVAFPHRLGAGPGAFAADVEHRSACLTGRETLVDAGSDPSIRKTVGGRIEDRHHLRMVEPDGARAQLQRRTRGSQCGPSGGADVVRETVLNLRNRHQRGRDSPVTADRQHFDRAKPLHRPRQPSDLPVIAERRVDESGRAKDGSKGHWLSPLAPNG